MKETRIYMLYTGSFGDSGSLSGIYKYKKDALAHIKSMGKFKKDKNRQDPFFENFNDSVWYRIDEDYIIGD